ncbi:hypothetical protein AUEXF2481DRAFT_576178 [Aureobasidium subglaciale EXF-2481]|uniref:Zn(2)-C6 fungal-type domain-containing protein n=1 Tax=Aureobasidium subglaciale (strain EXF-2481) TaxID=1043005 RepID=A0A074Y7S1_AURSE|nr:uncharacterized protein AUEXF2481DRAFT_576178 [Aureobasidium subglaciale EXF-2481]KAI5194528.1 hypothetical protein E4T38_09532 [Aureobasidium subglaciale]KAI5213752.1 hypothetical protein E4T40_09474 [Aureobasidium subglaciale]KAI5215629.1 hypothetical protein E4T41_09511 [Aureobasidium subglaciale]KAI5253664.1 hypothetical protein E4T46_09466 [Aureobasidium subglaciale]KEQ90262.1 hypothetical protein AUEXF2481DRAFT_576178 [Aureobasidium subglaciale EXF-2481]
MGNDHLRNVPSSTYNNRARSELSYSLMDLLTLSGQKSGNPNGVALQCEQCAKRKIRCDKQQPCSACVKSGKTCSPVVRARLARGRKGGRPEGSLDLRHRIKRLEQLVLSARDLGGVGDPPVGESSHGVSGMEDTVVLQHGGLNSAEHPIGVEDLSQCPRFRKDVRRTMGASVWTQLSSELDGLRSAIEAQDDLDDLAPQSVEQTAFDNLSRNTSYLNSNAGMLNLSKEQMRKLLDVYTYRVDPVLKLIHLPTFKSALENGTHYLGKSDDNDSCGALRSAVVYAAICSLSDSDCLEFFGQDKSLLSGLWQETTAHHIRQVDIHKNHNIVALQALIIYVAAIRTQDHSAKTWTLISLAVRIAQSLKLHREESFHSLTVFQAQVARQTWQTLLTLDLRAAFDRCSDPVIASDSYDTQCPLDLLDADFDGTSISEPLITQRETVTAGPVTFLRLVAETQLLLRELCFVTAGEAKGPMTPMQSSLHVRDQAVASLERHLTQQYFSSLDPFVPLQNAILHFGKSILSYMKLYVIRPLQRHPSCITPVSGEGNVLSRAVQALEQSLLLQSELFKPWHWYFRGFAGWHPLAVLLAELSARQGDQMLVDRAWKVAESAYAIEATKVADGTSGPLWKPLVKLMAMARQRRDFDSQIRDRHNGQVESSLQTQSPLLSRSQASGISSSFEPGHSEPEDASLNWRFNNSLPYTAGPESFDTWLNDLETLPQDFELGLETGNTPWMNWQGFVDDVTQYSFEGWESGVPDFLFEK